MHERCKTDRRYRYVLAGVPRKRWPLELQTVEAQPTAPAAVESQAKPLRSPCIHLGKRRLPPADPLGVACHCPAREVWNCDIHGACTRGVKYPGVACCAPGQCNEYDAGNQDESGADEVARALDRIAGPERPHDNHRTWCQSPAVQRAHTIAYRQFLDQLPPYPGDRAGRGYIVIGGGKYAAGVYLSIRMLREVGSDLPVQVWHRGEAEPVPARVRELPGVTVVDAEAHPARSTWRVLGGWQLKMIAGLWSGFRQWIFSDADNYAVANPEPLFDSPTGAVIWPDIASNDGGVKWASYGVERPAVDRGTNGGSAVFDAERCWRALWLAHWFDMHSEFYYKPEWGVGGYGDQDQVRAAFHITGAPYTLPNDRPRVRRGIFIQNGLDGQPVFVHRIHDKPNPRRFNRKDRGLPLEETAHRLLAEFRS